jgi:glycosyltransferase involved in cell wall biosynthesis
MAPRLSEKPCILLLGPERGAVSGVSTHLNQLLGSDLVEDFDLQHFVVGSEGRPETSLQKLLRLLVSPFTLSARIVRLRPEIVHINGPLDHKAFPRDAVYLAVARMLRRKVVFQVHGGELPPDLYKSGFLRDQFVRRVLKSATIIVLLAQSELKAYSEFVPEVPLRVIPNGVVVDPRAAIREHVTTAPLKLAYVGRLVPTKGVAVCIEAARLLRDSGRDFKLTIAGSGPEEDALKAQAGTLIEENRVEFVGARFGEAKFQLWQDTDLFVFPTNHHEGLPYALLESMASGAVPITTRVGAQPDVIADGLNGIFIPQRDPKALFHAIVALDDDRQRLLTMSQQCVLRIRGAYSVERLSARFGDLYTSVALQPAVSARRARRSLR